MPKGRTIPHTAADLADRVEVDVTFTRPDWQRRGLTPRVSHYAGPREWVRRQLDHYNEPGADYIVLGTETKEVRPQ